MNQIDWWRIGKFAVAGTMQLHNMHVGQLMASDAYHISCTAQICRRSTRSKDERYNVTTGLHT